MPRKYKPLTYARVLQAIKAGRITVDLKTLQIFKDGRDWMCVRRKCVPDGHELHHRDRNKRNNRYSNLQSMSLARHRAVTSGSDYPAEWDDVVDSEAEWEYFLKE